MFEQDVLNEIKDLTKRLNTTQASLVNNLVKFALKNADVDSFSLETAKKRGRKPGSGKKDAPETSSDE